MFGNTADYYILKPLTHNRNRVTEEELDIHAGESTYVLKDAPGYSIYTLDEARAYTGKALKLYFGNRLPIDPELSYLDAGCGTGRLSVGLSLLGMKDVTGVDITARSIATAKSVSEKLPPGTRPNFYHSSSAKTADQTYDVVIALAVMEHVSRPDQFLNEIRDLLNPHGQAFVSMTPFHGPLGDHMSRFFKVQIPWRGVIFFGESYPTTQSRMLPANRTCKTLPRYHRWTEPDDYQPILPIRE